MARFFKHIKKDIFAMHTRMKLFFSFLIMLGVIVVSGFGTSAGLHNWYPALVKPPFNPPEWIFGPVWTLLYILMAISLYEVWKMPPSKSRNIALFIFFIQLLLNFIWSFIFFYFREITLAAVDIVLLLILIGLTMLAFSRLNKTAAWLLAPYLLWVGFATILNIAIVRLNIGYT